MSAKTYNPQVLYFSPSPRGTLETALKDRTSLRSVAPESPRPSEMLAGVTVDRRLVGDKNLDLSAHDLALHELLISKAYESDVRMTATSYSIPLAECLRFLGTEARRDTVEAALRKMEDVRLSFAGDEGRSYQGVQMLTSWQATTATETSIGYQFPDPIRWLMRSMPSYGYIELSAIGQGSMKSRYSQLLYKRLAHEVSRRRWKDGESNEFTLEFTVEEFADVVGFPRIKGTVPFGKLQERVISRIADDFFGVRKFDVAVSFDGSPLPKKGRTVQKIELTLTVHVDSHHTVRADDRGLRKKGFTVGAPDEARFRLNSVVPMRIATRFKSLYLTHFLAHWTWLVVVKEALDDKALTPEYNTRSYRGKLLLAAIDANGAEAAAFRFFEEESVLGANICGSHHVLRQLPAAQKDRVARLKTKKSKKAPIARRTSHDATTQPAATFENCVAIEAMIDPCLTPRDIDSIIFECMSNYPWTGTGAARAIKVRFRFFVDQRAGLTDILEMTVKPFDEDELMLGLKRIGNYIDLPFYTLSEGAGA